MINQQSFSDLLGDIYSSASDFSNWQQVLRRVADVFGGNCSVSGVTDEKQHFSAYVAPLTDPAFVTSYNAHYHAISPLMPRIRALPTGSVVTDRMVLPRREFVRSDIYNEWILPQGIKNKLYTMVLSEPSRRVILGVHSEREFDDEQIRFCQLLTPHLQRAMQLSLSFLHVDMVQATAMQALDRLQDGVLVVGERSEIIFMNRAAEALFEPGGGLRLDGGRLTTSNPRQAAELRQLLSRCQSRRSDGE